MRDERQIVGLAGGSGITPFCSMAKEIVHGNMDARLLLLYGSSDEDDIVYYELFKELEEKAAGKIRVVHVLSCEEVSLEGCEQGFITADTIRKHAGVPKTSKLTIAATSGSPVSGDRKHASSIARHKTPSR